VAKKHFLEKSVAKKHFLEKSVAKKQPFFQKGLCFKNNPMEEKVQAKQVGPKKHFLEKSVAKKQPFFQKGLCQKKTTFCRRNK